MTMNDDALLKRDLERDIWQETLEAVNDIKAGKVGRTQIIAQANIIEIRQNTGLSQSRFAELLGVSVRTLQEWEQGRRQPSRAAQSLLIIAQQRPEILRDIFG